MKIIFAQGNPEPDYSKTRHNIGFEVLNTIATKNNLTWLKKPKFNADTTELIIDGEKTILVKPTTYYNDTGTSIRKIIDFYKIDTVNGLLVIHDDLALDFGVIRIREQGSDAGNNGIKSINSHLEGTYSRIRIGISNELRPQIDDAQFVTSKFNQPEHQKLENDIIPRIVESIHDFCKGNLKITSYKITE